MTSTRSRNTKRAVKLVRRLLRDGPLLAQDVYSYAEGENIPKPAVLRAKRQLGVRTTNINNRSPLAVWKCWLWSLPVQSVPRASDVVTYDDSPPPDDPPQPAAAKRDPREPLPWED
jgi:hypothetical protein